LLQQLDALEAEEKQLTSQLEGITGQLNQVQSQNSALAAQPPDDELEVLLVLHGLNLLPHPVFDGSCNEKLSL
jgi:hypothetical protein